MTCAYIISDVDVTNAEQYESYKKLSTIAIQTHGAEICVRGGAAEAIEGDWLPSRIVVLKFSSREKAQAFATSPEYAAARKAREGAALMRMILVDGI